MGVRKRSSMRLVGWVGLAVVMLGALSVTAYALSRGAKLPPKRPLAVALHDALSAGPVAGVSARFTVTQHLLPGSNALSASPLAGATGSVWASGGHVRVTIRSQLGTEQLSYDGRTLALYDAKHHVAYQLPTPQAHATDAHAASRRTPSVTDISNVLAQLGRGALVSAATPGNIAGQPAYTVRLKARHDAGLIGPLAIAWDATHGVPLRFALYPRGSSTPALEVAVTHISFGKLSTSDTTLRLPTGTHVERLQMPQRSMLRSAGRHVTTATGAAAVARAVGFRPLAPATLAGMPLGSVRSITTGKGGAAVLAYGRGLGTVFVIEQRSSASHGMIASLPGVSVAGLHGQVLETTLGTLVQFSRAGITYTVVGSQTATTILDAAKSLH
jgi:hypothetical protein